MSGAVLAVLAQLVTGAIRNYRGYRFLLGLLREEVADIAKAIEERLNHPHLAVPLYPSLPTTAWEALVESPNRRYMNEKRRKAVSHLYREVGHANHHLDLVPTALQISQLAPDEATRDVYREETLRLLMAPLDKVKSALPEARRVLRIQAAVAGGTPGGSAV
ncbi:hypothetical protein [Streptomyces sp. 7N604]|uniref:hypothetical protein n=1 Tax=Streptomyces sp. 7N604 TaxID=3457415 RepID=UPI003FCF3DAF